jgi:hypothetical protein
LGLVSGVRAGLHYRYLGVLAGLMTASFFGLILIIYTNEIINTENSEIGGGLSVWKRGG